MFFEIAQDVLPIGQVVKGAKNGRPKKSKKMLLYQFVNFFCAFK